MTRDVKIHRPVDESTLVLGIETSCDETAAALVMGGYDVVSSAVSTQVDLHAQYGGVVPESACSARIGAEGDIDVGERPGEARG